MTGSIQAEARKVLKAVSSWLRVKGEKATTDEIKVSAHLHEVFPPFFIA
jgi:hypothetical protein